MQQEIWKDIPEYEGLYQCSNFGNVRSLDRNCGPFNRKLKGVYLKKDIVKGYEKVSLGKNHERFGVHQLVAMCFLSHKKQKYNKVIDHIDGNRSNNKLSNLREVTVRENVSKCYRIDLGRKSSKYVGVSKHKCGRWQAGIRINNKIKYIGLFKNELDASNAYQNELKKII